MLNKNNLKDIYSLSPLQEGMLFHAALSRDSSAYIEQTDFLIEGFFDAVAFKKSWALVIQKYDAFRSVFVTKKSDRPLQVILKELDFDLRIENISNLNDGQKKSYLNQFRQNDIKKGFDLNKGPLFRLAIFELGGSQHQIIWTFHHIILDGWSLGIVVKDLFDFYRALSNKTQVVLGDVVPYSNYVKWLSSIDTKVGLQYWSQYLQVVEKQSRLPQLINPEGKFALKKIKRKFSRGVSDAFKTFGSKQNLTLNTIFQTLYAACVQLYTGENQVVFGTTISGRNGSLKNLDKMVGMFINTIPVVVDFSQSKSFLDLAITFQKNFIECEKHAYCSLANIQNQSVLKADLISQLLVFENYPLEEMMSTLESTGLKVKEILGFEHTNFDFEILVFPSNEIEIEIKFNSFAYDENFINDFADHLFYLSSRVLHNPQEAIEKVNVISEDKQIFLTKDVNSNWPQEPKIHSDSATVIGLFKNHVNQNPKKIAIYTEKKSITYEELNFKSNQIASKLINEYKVKPGQLIAILANRDEFAVEVFLGILKAGAGYVPIDPTYPQEKAAFMLLDSEATLLIVADQFANRNFESYNHKVLYQSDFETKGSVPDIDLSVVDAIAYVIYTSGSTGKAKGCLITNTNLFHLIHNAQLMYDFHCNDVWVTTHSFCFDFSIWEIYGALCYGASLVIPSNATIKDLTLLSELMSQKKVTIFNQTPPAFYQFIDEALRTNIDLACIRKVIFGGDRLDMAPLKRWVQKYSLDKTALINMYGITETTVHVSFKNLTHDDIYLSNGESPIGVAIPGYQIYILDQHKRIVPNFVTGELYVGGKGVAQGYLNRKELTAERFVPLPSISGDILYRSGDVAFRKANGGVFYLGRNDDQVQLRGFRVELGEICHKLESHPSVQNGFVLPIKDGKRDDRLVGFYTVKPGYHISSGELSQFLSLSLPEYMVPKQLYLIEKMPLTSNGKTDREALRKIESGLVSQSISNEFVEPRNELEKEMAKIWCQILDIKKVGIHNNFFELGGHSIKAIQLSSALQKNLNLHFSIKEIFEAPTIEQLAHFAQYKKPSVYAKIKKVDKLSHYDVTHAQKRLWITEKVNGSSSVYHIQGGFEIKGFLKLEKLNTAFSLLLKRHESLRTNFFEIDDLPYQIIRDNYESNILQIKVGSIDDVKNEMLRDSQKVFDLENDLLVRAHVYELNNSHFVLSFCIHHIIADGWSMGVFLNELASLYNGNTLPEFHIQYKDFTYWQNDAIQHSVTVGSQKNFWLNHLEGDLPVLDLPTDYFRPDKRSDVGASTHFEMPAALVSNFKKYLESKQLSLFVGLFSFYNLLLHKYSHQNDILVGFPISGRYHPDLQDQIGYYLNTLPMRSRIEETSSVEDFLKLTDENIKNAFENQIYPFDLLMQENNLRRGENQVGLYDVMFTLQNFDAGSLTFNDTDTKVLDIDIPVSKFEMTMICKEVADTIEVSIEYSTELFKKETVDRFGSCFVQLLNSFLENVKSSVGELTLLSNVEYNKILYDFNQDSLQAINNGLYQEKSSIGSEFYRISNQFASQIAIVDDKAKWTYFEFEKRANQIAQYLIKEQKLKPGESVGLFLNKSVDMVASIFGVLLAGGVYVPVDANNPISRIKFLFEDSDCKLILVDSKSKILLQGTISNIKEVETINGSADRLSISTNASSIAYIMYTSGSTGVPKGVRIKHQSVLSLIHDSNFNSIQFTDRLLQLSNYAFDGSVYDIFGALLNGASLYMISKDDMALPESICTYIKKNNINKTFITTALFNVLVDYDASIIHEFDQIIMGGQEASWRHVSLALPHQKKPKSIINGYGPTETTTFSATYEFVAEPNQNQKLPIGKPVRGDLIYILDDHLKPCPIGVIGEIYISGLGVGEGYLNRPDLNKKVFLSDPFHKNFIMYRTNDIGRWNNNGEIIFHGRNDSQVKIRGYRVEIGDIEAALKRINDVQQAHVYVLDGSNGENIEFVGYYLATKTLNALQLRENLLQLIPAYMIPSFLIQVDNFPLNVNGKVDRKLLPKPGEEKDSQEIKTHEFSSTEKILYDIWCALLHRKSFALTDNYFSLGGDSIKAIQMIAKLRENNLKLAIKDLYKYPNIKELSAIIKPIRQTTEQLVVNGICPLSPIQQWFFETKSGDLNHFVQDILLELQSTISLQHIQKAFVTLIKSHDILRSRYIKRNGEVLQEILPEINFNVNEISLKSESDIEFCAAECVSRIQIEVGGLLQAVMIHVNQKTFLYCAIHHLAIDGVSWRILLNDLHELFLNHNTNNLLRSNPFNSWVNQLHQYSSFKTSSSYWQDILKQKCGQLGNPIVKTFEQSVENSSIDEKTTELLLGQAHTSFNTQVNDLLLFALANSLTKIHGENNSLIYLEGHGREEIFEDMDISRTVGWFTSLYPVLLNANKSDQMSSNIKNFKEDMRKIPFNGLGYGVLRYLHKEVSLDLIAKPQVSFNYLGQMEDEQGFSLFKVSDLPTTKTVADHLMFTTGAEFNCYVRNGKLQIQLTYNKEYINANTAKRIVSEFVLHLSNVVKFCVTTNDGGITPSDIDLDGIDVESLDNLLENL